MRGRSLGAPATPGGADVASQGRRDSNPQPPVLETGALPIAPLPFGGLRCRARDAGTPNRGRRQHRHGQCTHCPPAASTAAVARTGVTSGSVAAVSTAACRRTPGHRRTPRRARVSARIGGDRRVRHARGRRQGQGAQGRRPPVIGFGAGEPDFPTPDYIVEAAVAACARPREPPLHPGRRAARAARGDRRQDAARLRLRGRRRPGARHQRRQAGGLPGVRRAVDPGDEVLLPAPYWTTYPEAIRLAGGVPVEVFAGESTRATSSPSSSSRRRAPTATKVLLFVLAVQPDRRGLPARAGRGHRRAGRSSTASGSSPTRSTSTSSTTTPRSRLDARRGPRARRPHASSSTASPRPTR